MYTERETDTEWKCVRERGKSTITYVTLTLSQASFKDAILYHHKQPSSEEMSLQGHKQIAKSSTSLTATTNTQTTLKGTQIQPDTLTPVTIYQQYGQCTDQHHKSRMIKYAFTHQSWGSHEEKGSMVVHPLDTTGFRWTAWPISRVRMFHNMEPGVF